MSNEHTHDPQEPTGARLTEANARFLVARAADYQHYMDDLPENAALRAMRMLATDVLAFAADRTALVAEVTRLQGDTNRNGAVLASVRYVLAATRAQVAAMRPLVERIARGDSHEFYVSIFGDTCCIGCNATASTHIDFPHDDDCTVLAARALVATWQPPAAPTPLPTRYVRTEDGGIESAPGGLLYTTDCNFTEAEWVALLALLNEGHDNLTWEEIEPLVAARVEANAAPTPDAVPPEPPDDADDLAGWDDEWNEGMRKFWAKNGMRWEPDGVFEIADAAPTPDGPIIYPPTDPREQARIEREIILDSGVDFAEHYAGLVDDPTDDDDAPTPDGPEGGDA